MAACVRGPAAGWRRRRRRAPRRSARARRRHGRGRAGSVVYGPWARRGEGGGRGGGSARQLGPEVLDDEVDGRAAHGARVAARAERARALEAAGDVARLAVDEGRVPRIC